MTDRINRMMAQKKELKVSRFKTEELEREVLSPMRSPKQTKQSTEPIVSKEVPKTTKSPKKSIPKTSPKPMVSVNERKRVKN